MTSAVRSLADDFGLRVVVVGSSNSIPAELLATNKEAVNKEAESMSRDRLESILELEGFHSCPQNYLS